MILCSSYCCSTVGWLYIWIGTKHLHIQALQFRTKTRREKSESFWESPSGTGQPSVLLSATRAADWVSLSNTHFFYFKIYFTLFKYKQKSQEEMLYILILVITESCRITSSRMQKKKVDTSLVLCIIFFFSKGKMI